MERAAKRDGNKNTLAKQLGAPKSYYKGEGDNIVVLIDNVRDGNFYDQDNAGTHSYIAASTPASSTTSSIGL